MCGLIGYINKNGGVSSFIKYNIHKLKYRGVDSFGYLVQDINGNLSFLFKKIRGINRGLMIKENRNFTDAVGIGHTRWSQIGETNIENTHPISSYDNVIHLIHNGTISNYIDFKKNLSKIIPFTTTTDTELLANYLSINIKEVDTIDDLKNAVIKVINDLDGDYSFAFLCSKFPGKIFGVNKGLPLLFNDNILCSDPVIFENGGFTRSKTGDFIVLEDKNNIVVCKSVLNTEVKQSDDNLMLNEIYEQVDIIKKDKLDKINNLPKYKYICFIGCGTSYHSAMMGEYYFNKFSNIHSFYKYSCDINHDYIRRFYYFNDRVLFVLISQSGETKDTLDVIKYLSGFDVACITNNMFSSITDLSKYIIPIGAGLERSVAATKTFSLSIIRILEILAFWGFLNFKEMFNNIRELYRFMINQDIDKIVKFANIIKEYKNIICLGRGYNYILGLELSLKMKEVSLIHAEGINASEMKHGPLALIDKDTISLFITSGNDDDFDKICINIQEVITRNGRVIVFCDENQVDTLSVLVGFDNLLITSNINNYLQPILNIYILQILSYYTAKLKGLDPSFPRNLSKSITVN